MQRIAESMADVMRRVAEGDIDSAAAVDYFLGLVRRPRGVVVEISEGRAK